MTFPRFLGVVSQIETYWQKFQLSPSAEKAFCELTVALKVQNAERREDAIRLEDTNLGFPPVGREQVGEGRNNGRNNSPSRVKTNSSTLNGGQSNGSATCVNPRILIISFREGILQRIIQLCGLAVDQFDAERLARMIVKEILYAKNQVM
jgi:hypothetical protein